MPDRRTRALGVVALAAIIGAVGPAAPFGWSPVDAGARALVGAGLAWAVLRLTQRLAGTVIAEIGQALVALGAVVVVAALDTLAAAVAWLFVAVLVAALGPPAVRRTLGVLAALAVVFSFAGAVALMRTATALDDAADRARVLDDLVLTEPDTAQQQLARVEADIRDAERAMDAWWAQPARLVPVVSRHFRFADRTVRAATDLTTAAAPLIGTEPTDLITTGRIDIDAVRRLAGDIDAAAAEATRAEADLAAHDRRWILGPARDALDDMVDEVGDVAEQLTRIARQSSDLLPVLGADGPVRWFVLACTPAEARATCGFPANWVEVVFDDGAAELVDAGRTAALEEELALVDFALDPDTEFARHYGRFEPVPILRNITMSPDFPATADVVHDALVSIGRPPPDVVAGVNTDGIEALLRLTGPVDAGAMGRLTPRNVRQRLDIEQYERFDTQGARRAALDEATRAVFDALARLDTIDPSRVRQLAEPIERGGFLASIPGDPDNVFVDMGMAGALSTDPLAAVTMQNAGGNKLDAYRSVAMTLTPATAGSTGCAEIVIVMGRAGPDTAPYAFGNMVDLPTGWIRSWVSVYTPTPVQAAFLDDEPILFESRVENGHPAIGLFVDTAPDSTMTLTLELAAGQPDGPVATREQPSVLPFTVDLTTDCPGSAGG